MKLVDDWKDAWRWHSTQLMTLAVSFPLIWEQLPADAKALIPVTWEPWIPTVLIIAAMLGRLRAQK